MLSGLSMLRKAMGGLALLLVELLSEGPLQGGEAFCVTIVCIY